MHCGHREKSRIECKNGNGTVLSGAGGYCFGDKNTNLEFAKNVIKKSKLAALRQLTFYNNANFKALSISKSPPMHPSTKNGPEFRTGREMSGMVVQEKWEYVRLLRNKTYKTYKIY